MILSQKQLAEEVERGSIRFDPLPDDACWGQASVDLSLGYEFTTLKSVQGITLSLAQGMRGLIDTGLWRTRNLDQQDDLNGPPAFDLQPGQFVLAKTLEKVTVPRHLIGRVEGRSTYARFGLSVHQTAPWIQPGWEGHITLEIMNNGTFPIKLCPINDKPCQITFSPLTSEIEEGLEYGAGGKGSFQGQTHTLGQTR